MWAYLDESGDLGIKGSKIIVLVLLITEDIDLLDRIIKSLQNKLKQSKKGQMYLNSSDGEIKFARFPDEKLLVSTLHAISLSKSHVFSVVIDKKSIGKNISPEEKELILQGLVNYAVTRCFEKNKEILFGIDQENERDPTKILASPIVQNVIMDETLKYIKSKKVTKITSDFSYFENIKKHQDQYYCLEKKSMKKITFRGLVTHFYFKIEKIKEEQTEEHANNPNCVIVKIVQANSRDNTKLQALDLISGAIFKKLENDEDKYFNTIKGIIKCVQDVTKEIKKKK